MKHSGFPIPARLNVFLATLVLALVIGIFWTAGHAANWPITALLALAYGIVMNTGYALLHEAEHNLFHPNRTINEAGGVILALFFPAPFHLLRQGHLGHHMRNRSDDEAFDYYFAGENPVWKRLQLYGILTGLFWVVILFSNVLAVLNPAWLASKKVGFDRPTEALQETLNPKYWRLIRLESMMIFLLHAAIIYFFKIPLGHYLALLFGFGLIWSALQYVHHFGTSRHVQKGARNLKTWSLIDLVWLNHNWHLNHHMSPTVPWIYLPLLYQGPEFSRGSLVWAYLKMWRGPRFTSVHVQNRYAGKIIK
jgi:fatty acid desaturase